MRVRDRVNASLSYVVSSDAQGFRSNGPMRSGRQGEPVKILCLGDSYTYGYGVDDAFTYPAQLETMLASSMPELSFHVMNAGYPRYGIAEEADFFGRKGGAIRPDLVILQFFLNDIQDMVHQEPFGSYLKKATRRARESGLLPVLSRFELYRFARKLHIARAATEQNYASEEERQAFSQGAPFRETLTAEQRSLVATYEGIVGDTSQTTLAPLWQEYIQNVVELRDAVEKSGSSFVLMIVPDANQAYNYQLAASAALVPALLSQGVDVLDLTFDFMDQAFQKNAALFLQADPHCSPAGNALIARRIADNLAFVQQRPRWAGQRLPARDFAGLQKATLLFDAKHNAVEGSGAGIAQSLQDNLLLWADQELGVSTLGQRDRSRTGVLDVRVAPGELAAFLDIRFHYRLPAADSAIAVLVSGDGEHYVSVGNLSAKATGVRQDLDARFAAQACLVPLRSGRYTVRFVLHGGAELVTNTPGDARATPRPFDLRFYPGRDPAASAFDVKMAAFPDPVPGDFFNLQTLDRNIRTSGLLGVEADKGGKWRWGLGPETAVTFTLPEKRRIGLELEYSNVIERQGLSILVNGKEVYAVLDLEKCQWLKGNAQLRLEVEGMPGENTILLRYAKWNGHGGVVAENDTNPYALAFTRFVVRGLPVEK